MRSPPAPIWSFLSLSLAACYSHESYLLSRAQVESVMQTPAPAAAEENPDAPSAILAVRESDHKSVWVKSAALRRSAAASSPVAVDADRVSISVRAPNPRISAGSVLTWVGTAVSLVGTVLFAVGKIQDNNPIFYAGGITALAAEPIMWTGTGLWLAGALHPPFETSALRAAAPPAPAAPATP